MDEQSKLEVALIENVQRENLNPIESANSYKRLIDEFSLTQEEVAKKVGKARPTIANALRLLSLPSEVKQALINNEITEGHARTLLNINDPEKQLELFREIKSGKITVRQAESKKKDNKNLAVDSKEIQKDPHFEAAQKRIGEKMGTKVLIKKKKSGGQIIIEYYSFEDLERIYRRLVSS
jgi:ParB family chromosome partitioning protein